MTTFFVVVHHRVRGDGEDRNPQRAFWAYDTELGKRWGAQHGLTEATSGADYGQRRFSFEAVCEAENNYAALKVVVVLSARVIAQVPECQGLTIDRQAYEAKVELAVIEDEHKRGHVAEQAM